MHYWTECRVFYREFRERYGTTGSILPSSPSLARALVSELRKHRPPRRILEVGPGTGAITVGILQQLRPGDRLDIVEINEHFIDVLRRRFEEEPLFKSRREQVQLIHAPLQDIKGEAAYDFVVSSLPHIILSLKLVREIFAAYRRLLTPTGVLSYYEYLAVRHLRPLVVGRRERRHLLVLGRFLEQRIREFEFRHQNVFLNVPPAVARHLRFGV
jgi:phospholipid N-methyltransferase